MDNNDMDEEKMEEFELPSEPVVPMDPIEPIEPVAPIEPIIPFPSGGCTDKLLKRDCESLNEFGYCEKSERMRKECPETCDTCQGMHYAICYSLNGINYSILVYIRES